MAKKQKAITTNAIRMITAAKLPHQVVEYETNGEVGENFGEEIAEKTGIPKEQSFKTLVIRGEKNGIMVACIPCNHEVDLKKFARATGEKKVEMIHVKELLGLTGYIRGSVSPIGMKKQFRTVIHESAASFEKIFFSGGKIGFQVEVRVEDLKKVLKFDFADIAD